LGAHTTMTDKMPSELLLNRKWSLCHDTVLRTTTYGALYGALSLLLFGKRWVIMFGVGTGMGLGLGLSECRSFFLRPTRFEPERILVVPRGTKLEDLNLNPK